MKTITKKIITILLLASMVASLCIAAFAIEKKDTTLHYMVLGDSIAAGFGLPGVEMGSFFQGKLTAPEECYSKLVQGYLKEAYDTEVSLDFYATSGGSTNFIRWMTDETVELNGGVEAWFSAEFKNNFQREEFNNDLKKADIISLNIGSNDMFTFPVFDAVLPALVPEWFSEGVKELPSTLIGKQLTGIKKIMSRLNASNEDVEKIIDIACVIDSINAGIADGIEAYQDNIEAIVRAIRDVNQSAEILLFGIYNPFGDYDFGLGVNVEPILDIAVSRFNSTIKSVAYKYGCIYLDTTGTETFYTTGEASKYESWGLPYSMIIPIHPTANGHLSLAKQVMDVLEKTKDIEVKFDDKYSYAEAYVNGKQVPVTFKDGKAIVTVKNVAAVNLTIYSYRKKGDRLPANVSTWALVYSPYRESFITQKITTPSNILNYFKRNK